MVKVTALLDFSQSEKTEELFDSEEPVIRSEQTNEERTGSEIVGGIPGVQSNLQSDTGQGTNATPPSSRSQKTTNYEISKVISKTVNPVGTIKNISVAVLIADKKAPEKDNEPEKLIPRTEAELNSLKNMISGALGLDKTRGDQIEVISMPFTEKIESPEVEKIADTMFYQYLPFVRYGLIFLGGIMVYFLIVRPIVSTMRKEVTEHYKTVEELEAEQQLTNKEKIKQYQVDPIANARETIVKDPSFSAHVIKNWINEG
jgi:flagellar M-ring protein FliF